MYSHCWVDGRALQQRRLPATLVVLTGIGRRVFVGAARGMTEWTALHYCHHVPQQRSTGKNTVSTTIFVTQTSTAAVLPLPPMECEVQCCSIGHQIAETRVQRPTNRRLLKRFSETLDRYRQREGSSERGQGLSFGSTLAADLYIIDMYVRTYKLSEHLGAYYVQCGHINDLLPTNPISTNSC